jgi:hypothetical protein
MSGLPTAAMDVRVRFKEEDEAGDVPIGPCTIIINGNPATLHDWVTIRQARAMAELYATTGELEYT